MDEFIKQYYFWGEVYVLFKKEGLSSLTHEC